MRAAGDRFGAGDAGERVQLEFVSANPTGPITVAAARHAAYGDSLARILELAGNDVEREYYVNDAGTQVRKFGESIRARARGEEPRGVPGRVRRRPGRAHRGRRRRRPGRARPARRRADARGHRRTLGRFRVQMDRYFSERSLHESGAVERGARAARGRLRVRGRAVAAHHGRGRRQGPRAAPLDRRARLLRARHRLPRRQARARLRPSHQRARARTTTATSSACTRPGQRSAATRTPTRS